MQRRCQVKKKHLYRRAKRYLCGTLNSDNHIFNRKALFTRNSVVTPGPKEKTKQNWTSVEVILALLLLALEAFPSQMDKQRCHLNVMDGLESNSFNDFRFLF